MEEEDEVLPACWVREWEYECESAVGTGGVVCVLYDECARVLGPEVALVPVLAPERCQLLASPASGNGMSISASSRWIWVQSLVR